MPLCVCVCVCVEADRWTESQKTINRQIDRGIERYTDTHIVRQAEGGMSYYLSSYYIDNLTRGWAPSLRHVIRCYDVIKSVLGRFRTSCVVN